MRNFHVRAQMTAKSAFWHEISDVQRECARCYSVFAWNLLLFLLFHRPATRKLFYSTAARRDVH